MMTFFFIFILGCVSGFLAGFLGLGGGVILAPLLIIFAPLIPESTLTLTEITGITAAQGFVSASCSWYFHRKLSLKSNIGWMLGLPMAVGAFLTAFLMTGWNDFIILFVFSTMLVMSIAFNFIPIKPTSLKFDKTILTLFAFFIGGLNGIIGQGGAFFFIPFFAYFLGIPLKLMIASAGLIGLLSVSSGLIPRLIQDTVPWLWVIGITPAIIIMSKIGATISQRMNELLLRRSILAVLTISFIQLIYKVQGQLL